MIPADPPPLRADARRNRDRLIAAALEAFSADAGATLESIAASAGVGIGTLYRHFATREALTEAVYRAELERLCDGAEELLGSLSAKEALRAWFDRYLEFVSTKRGMADALRAIIASGAISSANTRERLNGAIGTILAAGAAEGTLRGDVDPGVVSASLAGILLTSGSPDLHDQARQMLDLLAAGLRTDGPD
jgi:AcrR family transcriptional regulator